MMIRRTTCSLSPPTMPKSTSRTLKPPSPVTVSHFPTKGWMSNTRPTVCAVPGQVRTTIGYEDYYIHNERILCTRAFSVATVATTVDNGASPPGSTKLDDVSGHNWKMSSEKYRSFAQLVLGLNHNTWALARTERAFCNLIIQDLDAIMYDWDTNSYNMVRTPMSYCDEKWDMARTLAHLTLLLTGADACTPYIVDSVWGKDEAACLALGGPRSDLSLIRWKILTLSKVVMNMVHIWMMDPAMNFLAPNSPSFQ
jgi:hypothetical protein